MAGALSRHLKPGGVAILGGFVTTDWRRVATAHQAKGLTFVRRYEIDEWQTLVLKRS
jgi:ribosomal protein L11 methylase PrmA